jgi:UDP-N-acetylglucosamine acyltransferase
MSSPAGCRIHPTACISGDVEIGTNVEIGAFAVLEGPVRVGDNCVIRPGAYIFGPTTLGKANVVYSGAVLGESPQHLKYNNEPTTLEIGNGNIFREHVTVNRGTTHAMRTVIGNDNFFMANSHVAHDCVVGNRCIFVNGALIGGHCTIADNVILSGNSAVHQFCRVGRLALLAGGSATQKDIPPFIIQVGQDSVGGVNIIGMRRAGMSHHQINAVRQAYRLLFREGLVLPVAMARMEKDLGHIDAIQEMLIFLRGCTKGINFSRGRLHDEVAA